MARCAFVLGANGPNGPTRLKYAVRDAERITDVLQSREYGFSIKFPTHPSDPYDIKRELDTLATSCNEDDAFIFFFSGHGELLPGGLMLVLDETVPDKIMTYLPVSWVTEARDRCPARNRLIILDCCHAGAATGAKLGGSIDITQLGIEAKTEVMVLASRKLEMAREFGHLEGSFLTTEMHRFLGQRRRGVVVLRDVMAHLHAAAIGYNRTKAENQPKVPIPFLNGNQQGEFLFTIRSTSTKSGWIPISIRNHQNSVIWTGEHGEEQMVSHKAPLAESRLVSVGQPGEPSSVVWSHPVPVGKDAPSSSVITAYTRMRRRAWEYHFDGDSPFREQATYNFHVFDIRLFPVRGEWFWFVLFYDHPYFSSAMVVLDTKGHELKRLWHPGHLRRIVQLDDVLFAVEGFNNVRNLPGIPDSGVQHPHPPVLFAVRFDDILGTCFRQPLEKHFVWYYLFQNVHVKIEKFEVRMGHAYIEITQGKFFLIDKSGDVKRTGNLEDKQPPPEIDPVRLFPR